MKRIYIYTINDGYNDFCYLSRLLDSVVATAPLERIVFDFTYCTFIQQDGVAFLGGLIRLLQDNNIIVTLDLNTINKRVRINLEKNDFLKVFYNIDNFSSGNTVQFKEFRIYNPEQILIYLNTQWLKREFINISEDLRDLIISKVWEIFLNAHEHCESSSGVFACGQYYPNIQRLRLSIVDLGVGIPNKIKTFFGNNDIPSDSALKWAFTSGTSTQVSDTPRGLGLSLLCDFIRVNHGYLQVFSNDAYLKIDDTGMHYLITSESLKGTIFNIDIVCDETKYILNTEEVNVWK